LMALPAANIVFSHFRILSTLSHALSVFRTLRRSFRTFALLHLRKFYHSLANE